jgi:predicted helicase
MRQSDRSPSAEQNRTSTTYRIGDCSAPVEAAGSFGFFRTDATLTTYRGFYADSQISKEDIFYYVYGLLHSPTYKEQYTRRT